MVVIGVTSHLLSAADLLNHVRSHYRSKQRARLAEVVAVVLLTCKISSCGFCVNLCWMFLTLLQLGPPVERLDQGYQLFSVHRVSLTL